MNAHVILAAAAAAALLGTSAATSLAASSANAGSASAAATADTARERLRALFTASDEAHLERNPIEALFRGDLRGYEPRLLASTVVRPIDHFAGVQSWFPQVASGAGIAPFRSVDDYDDNLKRLDGYVAFLDASIVRMREGLAAGIVQPRLVMANVVEQLDNLLAQGIEGSTFYKPVVKFPDDLPADERRRLTAAYAAFIRERLDPAHRRLRDFIRDQYLPRARDSVGLGQMPGGLALYRHLIAKMTTTELEPQAIHGLGLEEVARIQAGMERVQEPVGFKGT